MKIKRILVSQPKPSTDRSPFFDLAEKNNLEIDFRPFICVEGVDCKEFRKFKVDILDHSAVIFTSKTAIDHFFRICEECRIVVPDTMKYFCNNQAIAHYLQKYIVYRKRKIFHGESSFQDVLELIKKHSGETYFLPTSDIHKDDIPRLLEDNKINYTKVILYRTVSSDLSDLAEVNYDMLVFFSPSGIKSLFQNFPDFKQNSTVIASAGPDTAKAALDAGLKLDVVPTSERPSIAMAIEDFLSQNGNS